MPPFKIPLNQLPAVVADIISEQLYNEGDTKTLAALARLLTFHQRANSLLYQFNVKKQESSAIRWACRQGNLETLRMLLKHGTDIDGQLAEYRSTQRTPSDETNPLFLAIGPGHVRIIELILSRRGVNLNRGNATDTPLSYAVECGQAEIVALLLAKDGIDVNTKIPLVRAARKGRIDLVKMLLAKEDINVDARRLSGQTALEVAAYGGHVDICKLLLARGADAGLRKDCSCPDGGALRWSIRRGHFEIAKLFLETAKIAPDLEDTAGFIGGPLCYSAACCEDQPMLVLLLSHGADLNSRRDGQKKPLIHAVQQGNSRAVKLLLASGADPDVVDEYGRTALSHVRHFHLFSQSSSREMVEVAKLLLESGANPDARCYKGRTPLSYLCQDLESIDVVKLLVDTGRVDVNSQCGCGTTPLSYAAMRHNVEGVSLLLGVDGIEPDIPSHDGQTLLLFSVARSSSPRSIPSLLLATNSVRLNIRCNDGNTPLLLAVTSRSEALVSLLFATGRVDVEAPCRDSRTVLSFAAENGHLDMVRLLLNVYRAKPDAPCNFGRTPLSYAAARGRQDGVTLLSATQGVDPNQECKMGWTPWRYALSEGRAECCSLLAPHTIGAKVQ
ncbi:putative ankyrin repeat protein [Cladobotryum mycophilum]|uniref:Ankyrin repeat protein n=1 Tax=Cladobotryum mycophilum TaxID=491253 RepID=A0ABR0T547_9HYPO